jgi:hypothetical protein
MSADSYTVAADTDDREESLDMSTDQPRPSSTPSESGFALILALLALLLLTFLGLTLAVTTSTELQIATNYRWSEQARYAAEAGAEIAKVQLRNTPAWGGLNGAAGVFLPAVRGTGWDGVAAPGTPAGTPRVVGGVTLRDYENANCDAKGNGMGYGLVLVSDGVPQQYISTFNTMQLTGAFTVWVRRPTWILSTGQFADWGAQIPGPPLFNPPAETLIMVVEGVAPFTNAGAYTATGAGGNLVSRSKAVYTIELPFSQAGATPNETCNFSNSGQTGGGAHNNGFGGCSLNGAAALDSARRGSTSTGTGDVREAR